MDLACYYMGVGLVTFRMLIGGKEIKDQVPRKGDAQIIYLYQQGYPVPEIMKRMKISHDGTVYNILRRNNVKPDRGTRLKRDPKLEAEIIRRYQKGDRCKKIAEDLKLGQYWTIYKVLKKHGIKPSRNKRRRE